jgi:outer membrane protein
MIIFMFLLSFSVGSAKALTLKEVYQSALSNTEVMKKSQSRLEQAQEKKTQASGAILPTVSIRGSYTEIDPPRTPGVSNAFTRSNQYNSAINVTQPLFRGLRDFAYFRQTKNNILLNQYLKDFNQMALYQAVIGAFYSLVISKNDFESIKTLYKYSEERSKEIRDRVRIGRSRRGELLQSESQVANALAAKVDAESLVVENKANLAFYLNAQTLTIENLIIDELPKKLESLDYYLGKAAERPDLKAKMTEIEVNDDSVSIAKGNHLPTVDVFGNYYLTRTGILANSKWDVGVNVALPLYQGGSVNSQVREAVEKKNETILNHQESRRTIDKDVTVLYESVSRSITQLFELEKALKKTEETYLESKKDYRYGLVTNLDVILALNSYVETKRNFERLQIQTLMNFKTLEAMSGVLP